MGSKPIESGEEANRGIINDHGFTDIRFAVFINDHKLISSLVENVASSFVFYQRNKSVDIARYHGEN